MGVAALSLFATRNVFSICACRPANRARTAARRSRRILRQPQPPDTVLLVTAQDWSKSHAGKWSEAIAKRRPPVVPVWPVKTARISSTGCGKPPAPAVAWRPRRPRCADARRTRRRQPARRRAGGRQTRPAGGRVEGAQGTRPSKTSRWRVSSPILPASTSSSWSTSALAGDALRAVAHVGRALRAEGEQVPGLLPILAMEILTPGAAWRASPPTAGNVMSAMREARVWESKQALYRRAIDRHPAVALGSAFVGECRAHRPHRPRVAATGDAWLIPGTPAGRRWRTPEGAHACWCPDGLRAPLRRHLRSDP